jgi:hypothetical protein
MGRRRRCSACRSENLIAINTLLATKTSFLRIEQEMRKLGTPIKSDTISAHFRICLDGRAELTEEDALVAGSLGGITAAQKDFATLIRERAVELLAAGEIRVTAAHGLQAQALIDRRAEKAADRDLTINIARLLSGSIISTPMRVIEGRAYEVETALLAPPEIVEA